MAQFNAFDTSFQEYAFQREWYVEPDSFVQTPGDCLRTSLAAQEVRVLLVQDTATVLEKVDE